MALAASPASPQGAVDEQLPLHLGDLFQQGPAVVRAVSVISLGLAAWPFSHSLTGSVFVSRRSSVGSLCG